LKQKTKASLIGGPFDGQVVDITDKGKIIMLVTLNMSVAIYDRKTCEGDIYYLFRGYIGDLESFTE